MRAGSYIEYFQGGDGQWYFNVRAGNHRILVDSEGYSRKFGAIRAARKMARLLGGLEVQERHQP